MRMHGDGEGMDGEPRWWVTALVAAFFMGWALFG